MNLFSITLRRLSLSLLACLPIAVSANEAVIRKALGERLNGMPKIEEVRPSAMPGLWEGAHRQ